jgi:hypothetical protein
VDKNFAKNLIDISKRFDSHIGEIDILISQIENIEEKRIWIEKLANLMRCINEEFIIPVERMYPEFIDE